MLRVGFKSLMIPRSVISGCVVCVVVAGCASAPDAKTTALAENAPAPSDMRDLPEDPMPGPEPSGLTIPSDDAAQGAAEPVVERVRIARVPTARIKVREQPEPATATSATEPEASTAAPSDPPPAVADAPTPPSATTPPAPPAAPQPQIDLHFVGDEIHVTINGRPVAKQHVRRTANAVEIIGTQGQVLQSIPIPQPPEHPPVMLGVRFEEPGEALVKHLGSDVNGCALVVSVMPNGPGYRAGIEDFDIITAVNGKSPATPAAIRSVLQRMSPGQSITLTVRRGKVSKDFVVETLAWKHIPLPAELQPEPTRPVPSPKIPGTPNMPTDTNDRGRPAAAPQRTATGG